MNNILKLVKIIVSNELKPLNKEFISVINIESI